MLDINPILLVITLAIFIFLIRYLNERLYVPLLEYMDERDKMLKGEQASANQNYSEIEALHREANGVLAKAREEAASTKEAIISKAKEEVAQQLENKKRRLSESYDEFKKELSTKRVSLKNQLLADSSSIEAALRDRFGSI